MRHEVLIHTLCWILGFSGVTQAQQDPFNVDIFFGWGGCFRPMEWTPIEVGIGSFRDEPFSGQLHMALPQDILNTLHISHPLVLTPDVPAQVPLVGRLSFSPEACRVRLTDEQGHNVWAANIPLLELPAERMQVVQRFDILVGVVGERRFGLLKLEEETISRTAGDEQAPQGSVYVRDKLARLLPWDWTGYVSLDLLICYDPDWSQLRPQQWQALADWVFKGGRLLFIPGQRNWPGDNALTRLLTVTPGPLKQVRLSASLLKQWALPSDNPPALSVTPLQAPAVQGLGVTDRQGEDILRITYPVGFGRVTVLGYDPRQLAAEFLDHSSSYWIQQVHDLLTVPQHGGLGVIKAGRTLTLAGTNRPSVDDHGYRFDITQAQEANNQVMEYLYDIDQMRPLSIGWVVGLLILLAILIGPVDYWVLKKIDRQPWTWITCTGWIALFTLGAYYGVQALRAGDLQLRSVSVTDAIAGNVTAWQTQYSGIFAPKSDDYRLTGLGERQWWSAMAPSQKHLNRYGGQYTRRDIFCMQQGGSNLPVSIPISIWTMQCLRHETPVPGLPLAVEVERHDEELRVSVVNNSEFSFQRAVLVFQGQRGLDLGPLPSGDISIQEGRCQPLQDWWNQPGIRGRLGLADLFIAEGCQERSAAMEAYMDAGAAVLIAERETDSSTIGLTASDCQVHHIDIQRLVVFPP
jgi:hypothetical protein